MSTSNDDMNAFNQQVIEEFRANDGKVGGGFAGFPMVLITAVGAKSGQPRTFPLVWSADGDDVVIAASMGGAPKHPAWYHNIVANPHVTVELPGETFETDAKVLASGPERDRLYAAHAAAMPQFAEYQQKTTRTIPVVVLSRP